MRSTGKVDSKDTGQVAWVICSRSSRAYKGSPGSDSSLFTLTKVPPATQAIKLSHREMEKLSEKRRLNLSIMAL